MTRVDIGETALNLVSPRALDFRLCLSDAVEQL